jgi:uracil-DNA glycosylase
MSDQKPPTASDPARAARQLLESYRAAGVEYLPGVPADRPALVFASAPTTEPAATPARQAALFLDPDAAQAAGATPEQRRQELTVLADVVSKCMRCPELCSSRTQTVFGVGPLDPDLCFVGEAPGGDEDRQGQPFVGRAGQLLNRIIAACGLKREEVFICNILRCRPPGNRQPQADEAANCREYLDKTLDLVRPRFLCCLGGSATKYLLGTSLGITKLRGQWREYRGIPVMCTYHPSFLLHKEGTPGGLAAKREVWDDMKKLLTRMGRPVPQGK